MAPRRAPPRDTDVQDALAWVAELAWAHAHRVDEDPNADRALRKIRDALTELRRASDEAYHRRIALALERDFVRIYGGVAQTSKHAPKAVALAPPRPTRLVAHGTWDPTIRTPQQQHDAIFQTLARWDFWGTRPERARDYVLTAKEIARHGPKETAKRMVAQLLGFRRSRRRAASGSSLHYWRRKGLRPASPDRLPTFYGLESARNDMIVHALRVLARTEHSK